MGFKRLPSATHASAAPSVINPQLLNKSTTRNVERRPVSRGYLEFFFKYMRSTIADRSSWDAFLGTLYGTATVVLRILPSFRRMRRLIVLPSLPTENLSVGSTAAADVA